MLTANKKKPVFPYSAADLKRIARECEERRAREPHAESARYDAATGRLCLELRGGVSVQVPLNSFRGFENATDEQRAALRIRDGREIWWDEIDEQIELSIVLEHALNIHEISEVAHQAQSPRKTATPRPNGAKSPKVKAAA